MTWFCCRGLSCPHVCVSDAVPAVTRRQACQTSARTASPRVEIQGCTAISGAATPNTSCASVQRFRPTPYPTPQPGQAASVSAQSTVRQAPKTSDQRREKLPSGITPAAAKYRWAQPIRLVGCCSRAPSHSPQQPIAASRPGRPFRQVNVSGSRPRCSRVCARDPRAEACSQCRIGDRCASRPAASLPARTSV